MQRYVSFALLCQIFVVQYVSSATESRPQYKRTRHIRMALNELQPSPGDTIMPTELQAIPRDTMAPKELQPLPRKRVWLFVDPYGDRMRKAGLFYVPQSRDQKNKGMALSQFMLLGRLGLIGEKEFA